MMRPVRFFALLAFLLAVAWQGCAAIDYENWMSALPDRAPLLSLSIPGTHDAGTKGFSFNAECQRYSIRDQLSIGVRAFDLRPGVNGNSLVIYHGSSTHGSETLGSIFDTYEAFLAAHPSEFLIIFLKDELGSDKWPEMMRRVLDDHAGRLLELNPYLTVEQMRGKMLVLSRVSWGDTSYGGVRVDGWQDNTTFDMTYRGQGGDELHCRIQDIYNASSSENLARKKADIEQLLAEAMAGTTGKLYINHTSGFTKNNYIINNHYVADCAEKCNELALNYLNAHRGPTGIILMDFAGTDRYSLTFSSHDTRGQLLVDALIENCQATAAVPPAPGPEWVLPMGADIPWKGRVWHLDAEKNTSAAVDALRAPASNWYRPDYDDGLWQELTMPTGSPNYGRFYYSRWSGEYNCRWFRREFQLDGFTSLLPHTLRIFHDDDCKVYVNGSLVYSADGWTSDEPVEKSVARYLRSGRNVIAAQVQQNTGDAYFDCGVYRTGEAVPELLFDETSADVPASAVCLGIKVKKKMTQNVWMPLCLPLNLTALQVAELMGEGTEIREPCAFEACGEDWYVAFAEVSTIRAGRPCLVRVPSTITGFEFAPQNGLNVTTTVNRPIRLSDKLGNKLTFTGYYPKSAMPQDCFIMVGNDFYRSTTSVKQNGYRAYFEAESADGTMVRHVYYLLGNADAIVQVTADGGPSYYDMSGRCLAERPLRGLYLQRDADGRVTKRMAGKD